MPRDSGSPGDGGIPPDSGNPGTDGGGSVGVGDVFFYQYSFTVSTTTVSGYSASASFLNGLSSSCTLSTAGSCQVYSCASNSALTPVNAGVIQITGGGQTVTLTPDGGTYPSMTSMSSELFTPGTYVMLSAAGGTVPAFNSTLPEPGELTLTSPALVLGMTVNLPRTAPLDVTWSGNSAGNATVSLAQNNGSTTTSAVCTWAASLGSGQIPAAALGAFNAGQGSLSASVTSSAPINAGGYLLTTTLESPMLNGAGSEAASIVNFQ
jgi:hypothetical protein